MINVTQEPDNSFKISWNESDPQESMLNDWTDEDFVKVITDFLDNQRQSN